jgi:hypothetical protein
VDPFHVVTNILGIAGTVASLVSVYVILNIKLAIANLQRDIQLQRKEDEDALKKWAEERFVWSRTHGD